VESATHGQSGQAAVEAAIVLPLLVAVLLTILQLALVQQARVLAEYAAYQAARAGVVHGGDPTRMDAAATYVLAPTVCPTRVPAAGAACGGAAGGVARQAAAVSVLAGVSAFARGAGSQFPGLRVDILSPYWPAHRRWFRTGGGEQMDFDDLRDAHPPPREGGDQPAADAGYREATLLTVRLLYWLELKIPVADAVVWSAWAAGLVAQRLAGALASPVAGDRATVLDHGSREELLSVLGVRVGNPLRAHELHRGSYDPVRTADLQAMVAAAAGGRFFLPVVAFHTMRMQSAFEARFIRGCSCAVSCGGECRAW
jgi:hypothetical protein